MIIIIVSSLRHISKILANESIILPPSSFKTISHFVLPIFAEIIRDTTGPEVFCNVNVLNKFLCLNKII